MSFDDLDRKIVAALVADARATYAEVGALIGLSAPAVKRRVVIHDQEDFGARKAL